MLLISFRYAVIGRFDAKGWIAYGGIVIRVVEEEVGPRGIPKQAVL
jgi:hypothetical protein